MHQIDAVSSSFTRRLGKKTSSLFIAIINKTLVFINSFFAVSVRIVAIGVAMEPQFNVMLGAFQNILTN